jgi:hypothetical protein
MAIFSVPCYLRISRRYEVAQFGLAFCWQTCSIKHRCLLCICGRGAPFGDGDGLYGAFRRKKVQNKCHPRPKTGKTKDRAIALKHISWRDCAIFPICQRLNCARLIAHFYNRARLYNPGLQGCSAVARQLLQWIDHLASWQSSKKQMNSWQTQQSHRIEFLWFC